jgi:eukaryotic-like serine/threonine-protein kinase
MLRTGDSFDRYQIESLLGEGGMGVIYRAHDPKLRRSVALKLVRFEPGEEPSRQEQRLFREARVAAGLHHPNTVAIFDVGSVAGQPFIAMELVEGTQLVDLLGDATIPLPNRIDWLADIARALAAAHRAGLVHRDVKPDNVMLRDDGVVKVLDFGIARRVQSDIDPDASTIDLRVHRTFATGTPMYMAPEHLVLEPVDGRSDQFSWGVLAYELLLGAHPWSGRDGDALTLARTILDYQPPPPASCDQNIPAHVSAAVMRAISKDPDARFPTMDALLAELSPDSKKSWVPPARSGGPVSLAPSTASAQAALAPGPPPRPTTSQSLYATTQASRGLRPRGKKILLALAALAVVGTGGVLVGKWLLGSNPTGEGPTAARPSPAAATYEEALEAMRRGRPYRPLLERALEQDESFAAAHMWLALERFSWQPTEARRHFKAARDHFDRLEDRDRALYEVFEPVISRDPAEPPEMLRRAETFVGRFPRDADIAFVYARALAELPAADLAKIVVALDQVLALDPRYVPALHFKAEFLGYMGRMAEAEAAAQTCIDVSADAMACQRIQALFDEEAGRCERVLESAKKRIAIDPDEPRAYGLKASALVALGKPEAARDALDLEWSRVPAAEAAYGRPLDEARLAVVGGDFEAALALLDQVAKSAAGKSDEWEHAQPLLLRIGILRETDRIADAAAAARSFAERREGLVPDPRSEDFAIARDPSPMLARVARLAGEIDTTELLGRRAAWLAAWAKRGGPWLKGLVWVKSLDFVATPDEARAVLDEPGVLDALPTYAPLMPIEARVGHVLSLAGRGRDALPHLEHAVVDCRMLAHPIEQITAWLELGKAREDAGDEKGACSAYGEVTSRWSKMPSISARDAAKRKRALGCTER